MKLDPKNNVVTASMSFGRIELEPFKLEEQLDLNDLPLLVTRNFVLFPGCTVSILLTRERALEVANHAQKNSIPIGVVCQLSEDNEDPSVPADLFRYGVVARVLQVVELPDERKMAIVHSFGKFKIVGPGATTDNRFDHASVKLVNEVVGKNHEKDVNIMAEILKEQVSKFLDTSNNQPNELSLNLGQLSDSVDIINLIATYAPATTDERMDLLKKYRISERGKTLIGLISRSIEGARLKQQLREETSARFSDDQRRAFLRREIDVIKDELDEGDDEDFNKLRQAADSIDWPVSVSEVFERELGKLTRIQPQSPDYAVLHTYLDTLVNLPWNKYDRVQSDIKAASQRLDMDHFGLEKAKKRVLEQLAMIINKPDVKAPILCLVGAPGVGKTSLGQSIARAMNLKYQRVSLGGVHDEAEIRGHRRTYIGALPGRIIDAVKRARSANPVLLLDEIDKLGNDYKGDPAAALLEALDPEQNCHFHDNYIDVDFDLSKVFFIATANTLTTIPRPLLDRMEVIELSGYHPQEKCEIARRHLLPRQLRENGLSADDLIVTDEALNIVIDKYTSESGVRQLEKSLAKIVRRFIYMRVSEGVTQMTVTPGNLREFLGVERYIRDKYDTNDFAGVATGLAWTEVGGEILFIETALTAASKDGGNLTLTGNLGNVMKESATIALQYVRAHASQLGIDPALFGRYNIHLHVPEGATPKDGPSAGITMATSLISALTQRRVADRIAMTGEMTLRGKVLPVGGIREKILAAKRAGITHIILSEDNRKDIEDIEAEYIDNVRFDYVRTMLDVARLAITDQSAANALSL